MCQVIAILSQFGPFFGWIELTIKWRLNAFLRSRKESGAQCTHIGNVSITQRKGSTSSDFIGSQQVYDLQHYVYCTKKRHIKCENEYNATRFHFSFLRQKTPLIATLDLQTLNSKTTTDITLHLLPAGFMASFKFDLIRQSQCLSFSRVGGVLWR